MIGKSAGSGELPLHSVPQKPTLTDRVGGVLSRNKVALLTSVGSTLALGTVAAVYRASGDASRLRGAEGSDSKSSDTAGGSKLLSVDLLSSVGSASRRIQGLQGNSAGPTITAQDVACSLESRNATGQVWTGEGVGGFVRAGCESDFDIIKEDLGRGAQASVDFRDVCLPDPGFRSLKQISDRKQALGCDSLSAPYGALTCPVEMTGRTYSDVLTVLTYGDNDYNVTTLANAQSAYNMSGIHFHGQTAQAVLIDVSNSTIHGYFVDGQLHNMTGGSANFPFNVTTSGSGVLQFRPTDQTCDEASFRLPAGVNLQTAAVSSSITEQPVVTNYNVTLLGNNTFTIENGNLPNGRYSCSNGGEVTAIDGAYTYNANGTALTGGSTTCTSADGTVQVTLRSASSVVDSGSGSGITNYNATLLGNNTFIIANGSLANGTHKCSNGGEVTVTDGEYVYSNNGTALTVSTTCTSSDGTVQLTLYPASSVVDPGSGSGITNYNAKLLGNNTFTIENGSLPNGRYTCSNGGEVTAKDGAYTYNANGTALTGSTTCTSADGTVQVTLRSASSVVIPVVTNSTLPTAGQLLRVGIQTIPTTCSSAQFVDGLTVGQTLSLPVIGGVKDLTLTRIDDRGVKYFSMDDSPVVKLNGTDVFEVSKDGWQKSSSFTVRDGKLQPKCETELAGMDPSAFVASTTRPTQELYFDELFPGGDVAYPSNDHDFYAKTKIPVTDFAEPVLSDNNKTSTLTFPGVGDDGANYTLTLRSDEDLTGVSVELDGASGSFYLKTQGQEIRLYDCNNNGVECSLSMASEVRGAESAFEARNGSRVLSISLHKKEWMTNYATQASEAGLTDTYDSEALKRNLGRSTRRLLKALEPQKREEIGILGSVKAFIYGEELMPSRAEAADELLTSHMLKRQSAQPAATEFSALGTDRLDAALDTFWISQPVFSAFNALYPLVNLFIGTKVHTGVYAKLERVIKFANLISLVSLLTQIGYASGTGMGVNTGFSKSEDSFFRPEKLELLGAVLSMVSTIALVHGWFSADTPNPWVKVNEKFKKEPKLLRAIVTAVKDGFHPFSNKTIINYGPLVDQIIKKSSESYNLKRFPNRLMGHTRLNEDAASTSTVHFADRMMEIFNRNKDRLKLFHGKSLENLYIGSKVAVDLGFNVVNSGEIRVSSPASDDYITVAYRSPTGKLTFKQSGGDNPKYNSETEYNLEGLRNYLKEAQEKKVDSSKEIARFVQLIERAVERFDVISSKDNLVPEGVDTGDVGIESELDALSDIASGKRKTELNELSAGIRVASQRTELYADALVRGIQSSQIKGLPKFVIVDSSEAFDKEILENSNKDKVVVIKEGTNLSPQASEECVFIGPDVSKDELRVFLEEGLNVDGSASVARFIHRMLGSTATQHEKLSRALELLVTVSG